MEKLSIKDLEGAIVNYYYVEIVENSDEDVEAYGMEKYEKSYCGYGGVIKGGVYYDISDDGGWEKVNSYEEVSSFLDKEYSQDEYDECGFWYWNLDNCSDSSDIARSIAETYRDRVTEDGYEDCVHDGRYYVTIWKDGKQIYAEDFYL